jgi:hypothetical protein
MSNERPNEFLPWRTKLNGTEATPGYRVDDTEQSWQRLAERLGKQPRRRAMAWWIAAACLILAFFFPAAHLFRGRPTHPARFATRPIPAGHDPRPSGPLQRVTKLQPAVSQQARIHRSAGVLAGITRPPVDVSARPTLPPLTAMVPVISTPAISGPAIAAAADSPALPAPLSAPKKQLKVVCFNEINSPATPPPGLAGREPEFLRISLGRMPGLGSGNAIAESNAPPFLTIKLIPRNN